MGKGKGHCGNNTELNLLISLIVAIPGYLFTYDLLKLTGTPADVIDMSAGFARIIFVAIPFVFLFNVYTTFFRGSGDSNTPFYFLVVSTVLNILLTPALVIGWGFFPAMGVNGAALANVIAMLVAFAAFLIYLKIVNHPCSLMGKQPATCASIGDPQTPGGHRYSHKHSNDFGLLIGHCGDFFYQ